MSARKSGESRGVRLATTSIATSAATRTPIPARISRGLSRNGRRRGDAGSRSAEGAGLGVIDVTVTDMIRGRSLFQQILQFAHELADVAEVPVDRRESDVRHLVQLLQLFHDVR